MENVSSIVMLLFGITFLGVTLLTPFSCYLLAAHFHVSGVLTTVASGLYLSYRSSEILTQQSRIMAYAVWEVVMAG